MIRFEIRPVHLALATGGDSVDVGSRRLLWHQERSRLLLLDHDLVVNSYPTGAGKTRAALLHLLDMPRDVEHEWLANTLIIAPTKELVNQHAADVGRFCKEHALPHEVLRLSADALAAENLPATFRRRGDRLDRLLSDPGVARGGRRKPIVAVSVPDLFHLALYFRYGRLDRTNLFRSMVERFGYIVVDETHYYNAKQLASFLFFIVLSKEYGYFQAGRRMALLTATPEPAVRTLLERLGLRIGFVEPSDEPAEATRTPSLAPVRIRVLRAGPDQGLHTIVPADREAIGKRLAAGEHGAVISSTLWRINLTRNALRSTSFSGRIGAITGPETASSRAASTVKDLILATPTVDIGYNFERAGKRRQPLDFLYFDARFRDEFLQRLGRAGRVLGRAETDHPSEVVAVVDERLYRLLDELNGREVSRAELSERFAGEASAARTHFLGYLESDAIGEVMLPLHRLAKITARDEVEDVEQAFQAIRDVFSPGSRRTFGQLRGRIARFCALEDALREENVDVSRLLDSWFDTFLEANGCGHYQTSERVEVREATLHGALREHFVDFLRGQHAVEAAHFAFRDSFEVPVALAWDPNHLLSSEDEVHFDVFHVLENFQLTIHEEPADWRKDSGLASTPADAYVSLHRVRLPSERLRVRFGLTVDRCRADWLADQTAGIRAFKRLWIELVGGCLPASLANVLAERWVVGLAVSKESRAQGRLRSVCAGAGFFPRELTVECADGRSAECLLLLGTGALLVAGEMRGALFAEQRRLATRAGPYIT